MALIERELVGVDCIYYTRLPSKAMLRPGETLSEQLRVEGAKEAVEDNLNVKAVLARRDEFADHGTAVSSRLC